MAAPGEWDSNAWHGGRETDTKKPGQKAGLSIKTIGATDRSDHNKLDVRIG
jgi:hypothetical protein